MRVGSVSDFLIYYFEMHHDFNSNQFLAAYIDVLGQSNKILENAVYPPTEHDLGKIKNNLQETSEYIIYLRKAFRKHLRAYRKLRQIFDGLSKKEKRTEQRLRMVNAEILGVSDSIIVNVPLENKTNNCVPINNILATFQGIALIYNLALAKHKPIRGGIDVGWGVKLSQNEVYGSALVKAYSLETEEAEYPRIVLGESLWQYINYVSNLRATSVDGQRACKIGMECKQLVVKDTDSKLILDVASDKLMPPFGKIIERDLVWYNYEAVRQILEKYTREGDSKLIQRYQRLQQYYNFALSRLPKS